MAAKFSIARFLLTSGLFLLQLLHDGTLLHAGTLKDFKKGVKKEQGSSQPTKSEPEKSPSSEQKSEPGECGFGCQFFNAIFSAIGKVWIGYNTSIYYDDYPYAGAAPLWATYREGEKTTRWEKIPPSGMPPNAHRSKPAGLADDEEMYTEAMETVYEADANGKMVQKQVPRYGIRKKKSARASTRNALPIDEYEVTETVMPDGKRSFLNIEAAGLYLDRETYGVGGGFQARLLGWFGLIGEYRQYRDKSDKLTFSSFGADFAIFQLGGFSWSAYVQYNAFSDLFALSGAGYGTRLQLFLGGRTALDLRIGKLAMTDINFVDYDLRFGLFIHRMQIFVGYRGIESAEARLAGFQGGVQLWL